MREDRTDLRVIRTKQSIREALVELMEEKGFEALTVKDITTKAKINRGTFYAHYQDKFDLMTKCEEEIMKDMSSMAIQNFPDVLAEMKTNSMTFSPFHPLVSIFEYLNENSGFMKAVLGPNGDLSFQTKLRAFMWETMFGDVASSLFDKEKLLVPSQYLISYVAAAHIGIIQQWLTSGRKESSEEMARILWTLAVNGPFGAAGLKK
jgi:AcrR family transcriptional regulator